MPVVSQPYVAFFSNDVVLGEALRIALPHSGFTFYPAFVGEDVRRALDWRGVPAVLISDIDPARHTWAEILSYTRYLRETWEFPLLLLGTESQLDELVDLAEMWQADMLTKPCRMPELLARIRWLARTGQGKCQPIAQVALGEQARMDFEGRRILTDQRPVPLSRLENKLLFVLSQNAGRPVPHATLVDKLWVSNPNGRDNLRSLVGRLRAKLRGVGLDGLIESVPAVGYRLNTTALPITGRTVLGEHARIL